MADLVSIIIPCYNCEAYVEEAIMSCINQTYKTIEVICVNDGSTDSTSDILCRISDEHENVTLYSIENAGGSYARNYGFEKANGTYIQFLDADDVLHPEKIELQICAFDDNIDFVLSDYETRDENLDKLLSTNICEDIHSKPIEFAVINVITTINPIYKSELLNRIKYNVDLPSAQDWEFHLRLLLAGARHRYVPGVLFTIRRLSDSVSSNWLSVAMIQSNVLEKMDESLIEMAKSPELIRSFGARLNYNISVHISSDYEDYFKRLEKWSSGNYLFLNSGFKKIIARLLGLRTLIKIDRIRLGKR